MYVKYRLLERGTSLRRRSDDAPDQARGPRRRARLDTYVESPGRTCPVTSRSPNVDPRSSPRPSSPGAGRGVHPARSRSVRRIVEHFFAEDKPFGTLCHGPQVPAALGHLARRRSSGFRRLAPDIEQAGASTSTAPRSSTGTWSRAAVGRPAEWSRAFLDVLDRAAVAGLNLTSQSRHTASVTVAAHARRQTEVPMRILRTASFACARDLLLRARLRTGRDELRGRLALPRTASAPPSSRTRL
jgi:protease I